MKSNIMNELLAACEAAEIPIYGEDFLCRVLAILHCYGGGPGSEYFRAGAAYAAAMKAGNMLEEAVMQKNWDIVGSFRAYVRELQADNAPWLNRTLDKLNIPAKEIKFQECVQPKLPRGT